MQPSKTQKRLARKRRIRAKVQGTPARPRMSVYRSLRQIAVQVIDDASGKTIAAASTLEIKAKPNADGARKVGELIATKAKDAKVKAVVFDRSGYTYHGRIKEMADAARKAGLEF